MNETDLNKILARPGYSIASAIPKRAIPSAIRKAPIEVAPQGDDAPGHVEPVALLESLQAKRVSLNYTGKVRVSVAFYRRRLADYSRANSEKAAVDCLVYAGLIRGDSEAEIWLEDLGQFKVETDEEERIELTISYPDVDLDNLWVKNTRRGNDGR